MKKIIYIEFINISFKIQLMIGQLQKRPQSKNFAINRPNTKSITEANKKQSEQCFQMGKKHMAKKQYPEALRHYFNATIHDPFNHKAFCNMGVILKELGNYKQAKSCYVRAISAKPDDYISLYNFGNLNRVAGDEDSAIPLYESVIQLKHQKSIQMGEIYQNCILNMGICYQNIGQFDEAIDKYEKYIKLCPKEEAGYFNKAMCYLKKIRKINRQKYNKVQLLLCREALEALEISDKINSNNQATKMGLIELKYLKNPTTEEYKSAIQQYTKLLETASINPEYLRNQIAYCETQVLMRKKSIQRPLSKASSKGLNQYDTVGKDKIDEQQNIGLRKRPESGIKRPESGVNRPMSKGIMRMPSRKGLTVSNEEETFRNLLDAGKFDEALEFVKKLPDSLQKYEKQMLINFLHGQSTGQEIYLRTAKQVYDHTIAVKPITKQSCSRDGHQLCALLMVELEEYELATKHYEILMEILGEKNSIGSDKNEQSDKKQEDNEMERVRSQLGILYAQRKMYKNAIQEFKQNLKKHPNNYEMSSNLCLCYIENKQPEEALKIYESYLKQNYPGYQNPESLNLDDQSKKQTYIDCLINIAICHNGMDKEAQVAALKAAKRQIERLYLTYSVIQEDFSDTSNFLGVYLRLSQIYEQMIENIPYSKAKEQNQQLLDFYLGCLDYPQCPDRAQILTNCGILFYLSGCYANAFMIYTKIHSKNVFNDLSLTLAHLEDYEQAIINIKKAVQNEPDNVIYFTNFEIMKWICGLYEQCNKNKLITEFPCRCEHMTHARSTYGLSLIDYLTEILSANYERTIRKQDISIEDQSAELLHFLMEEFSKNQQNPKVQFIIQYMKLHMKDFKVHNQQPFQLPKLKADLIEESMHVINGRQAYEKHFKEVMNYLKSMPPHPNYATYIQIFLSTYMIRNRIDGYVSYNLNRAAKSVCCISHASSTKPDKPTENPWQIEKIKKVQAMWGTFIKSLPVLEDYQYYFQQIDTQELKDVKIENYTHEADLNFNQSQLNVQAMGQWLRDAQCFIENNSQLLMEYIQETYYQSEGLVEPFRKQIRYAHCKDLSNCQNCYLKTLRSYTSFFKEAMNEDLLVINQKHTFEKGLKSMQEMFFTFTKNMLSKKELYSKNTGKVTLQINPFTTPFVLSTHHKTFAHVQKFLKLLQFKFELVLHEGDRQQRGVRNLYINKRVVLQLWWGEMFYNQKEASPDQIEKGLTYFDKYGTWLQHILTANANQGMIILKDSISLPEMSKIDWEDKEKLFPEGIKVLRCLSDDGQTVYKYALQHLLEIDNNSDASKYKKSN